MDKAKELPNGWEEADTPRATSWGVALGSTLLIAGCIHAAQLASQGYCMAMLQRQLKATLVNESQAGVVILDTRFEQLLPHEDGRVKAVRELIAALQLGDLPRAERLLETSKNLPSVPSIIKTRAHVVAATELINRKATLEDQQRTIAQKQLRTQQLSLLLAKDLGALLGVPAHEDQGSAVALYQSGVLSGLPQLAGVPDAIPDLKELQRHVSRAVAETLVTVGPKNQQFTERLKDLRSRGQQLHTENDTLIQQAKEATAALEGHADEVEAALNACREELVNIVLDIANPKLDADVVDAYGRVVNWGKVAGIELPPLGKA